MYLEQKGANYWACCPFHPEKTPSFAVNPQKGFYHCFGCGKSGNAISFLMEHEHMSYPEAITYLANQVGLQVEEEEETEEVRRARIKRERAWDALRKAARFYVDNLYGSRSERARAYIAKRGLNAETLKTFGIGCSLDYDSLPAVLEASGVSLETMRYAGLIGEYEGKAVDFEARRLVIPIIDHHGKVVGFGGRTLDETKRMKYKNTQATEVFDKRRTLFGLNLTKKMPQPLTYLILVEGYMDVISLFQAGFRNAVASMGTSLTPEQCALLKRYVNTVYVCYDGDGAGRNATWRSLDMLANAGLEVRVIRLPDELDPDDTVRKLGAEGFKKLLDAAMPAMDYKVSETAKRFNLTATDGKTKFAAAVLPMLANLTPVTREIYVKEVSRLTGLSEQSITDSAIALPTAQPSRQPQREEQAEKKGEKIPPEQRARIVATRFLLSAVFAMKPYVVWTDIEEAFFNYPPHKTVYQYIVRCLERRTRPVVGDIFDLLTDYDGEAKAILDAVEGVPDGMQEGYYRECLHVLTKARVEAKKKEILERLKTVPDGAEKESLKEELRKLISYKPASEQAKTSDAAATPMPRATRLEERIEPQVQPRNTRPVQPPDPQPMPQPTMAPSPEEETSQYGPGDDLPPWEGDDYGDVPLPSDDEAPMDYNEN